MSDPLHRYLEQHWVGAGGGLALFRRVSDTHQGTDVGREMAELTALVADAREQLRGVMERLGVERPRLTSLVASIGEKVGRLKPNGNPLRREYDTDLVEFDALRTGVAGQLALWEVLEEAANHDDRLDAAEIGAMCARARDILDRLSVLERRLAAAGIGGSRPGRASEVRGPRPDPAQAAVMASTGVVTAAVSVPVAEFSCVLPGATVTFLTWHGVPDDGLDRELGAQVGFSYTLGEVTEYPDGSAVRRLEPASDFRRLGGTCTSASARTPR